MSSIFPSDDGVIYYMWWRMSAEDYHVLGAIYRRPGAGVQATYRFKRENGQKSVYDIDMEGRSIEECREAIRQTMREASRLSGVDFGTYRESVFESDDKDVQLAKLMEIDKVETFRLPGSN